MGGPIFNQPVEGLDTGRGYGVHGRSSRGGSGMYGRSDSSDGSASKPAVFGESSTGIGVAGSSMRNIGVLGSSPLYEGVYGQSDSGVGVRGVCNKLFGVLGESSSGIGVYGVGLGCSAYGVAGFSPGGTGVSGGSYVGTGVRGRSESNIGVYGSSYSGIGVDGYSDSYIAVRGWSNSHFGVHGYSDNNYGVYAFSNSFDHYALYAGSNFGYAAWLDGEVNIRGPLIKPRGQFKIDHPLDPANKYLSHSFVESPDMKNVYDGVVALDDKGEAEIELPDWFSSLNKDFRYQLTAIGAPGPNLYIAEEISDGVTIYSNNSSSSNKNSRFKVAGGTSGMKVSWQVTGIRKDPYAKAHPIQVEEDKSAEEQGYYLYPDLYGQPEEKGINPLALSYRRRGGGGKARAAAHK
jgi:hypothetical protein